MSSVHGKLKGKKWSVWTEELGPGSPPGDTGRGDSNGGSSPVPDDVMKLSRDDMHTYGQCPIWDRFILVTCDKCSRKVKVESLESHITLRHGSKSERNAYHKVLAARASAALKACETKFVNRSEENEEKKTFSNPPDAFISGSSSSTSPLPVSYPSTPPQLAFRVSSPSPLPTPTPPLSSAPSIQPADSASAPDTRSPTPEVSGDIVEHMELDSQEENNIDMATGLSSSNTIKDTPVINPSASPNSAVRLNYMSEEADSTTHNVISIPDSEDIPNIEIGIISEGEVLDSINTKYNVSILKTDTSVDSTTSMSKSNAKPGHVQLTPPQLKPSVPPNMGVRSPLVSSLPLPIATPPRTPTHHPIPPIFQQQPPAPQQQSGPQQQQMLQQEKMELDISSAPTHYITVSPLSKGSPKKPVIIKTGLEKKVTGREREYDPNKHCGVWDADAKRNCTRSLTCKSHSVYLKRKVINRSGAFDELLAAHKAEKEAAAKLAESGESEPTSILARRLQLAPGTPQKVWEQAEPAKQSSVLKATLNKRSYFPQSIPTKDNYCDENLHYTTGRLRFIWLKSLLPVYPELNTC